MLSNYLHFTKHCGLAYKKRRHKPNSTTVLAVHGGRDVVITKSPFSWPVVSCLEWVVLLAGAALGISKSTGRGVRYIRVGIWPCHH